VKEKFSDPQQIRRTVPSSANSTEQPSESLPGNSKLAIVTAEAVGNTQSPVRIKVSVEYNIGGGKVVCLTLINGWVARDDSLTEGSMATLSWDKGLKISARYPARLLVEVYNNTGSDVIIRVSYQLDELEGV